MKSPLKPSPVSKKKVRRVVLVTGYVTPGQIHEKWIGNGKILDVGDLTMLTKLGRYEDKKVRLVAEIL
jgi:hypothetical protein